MPVCCFFRVRELRTAREHESVQKTSLTMWHYSPDSSVHLFCFNQRRFTKGRINSKNTVTYYRTTDTTATKLPHLFHISLFLRRFIYEGRSQPPGIKQTLRMPFFGGVTFASWHFLHFLMDWFVIFEERYLSVSFKGRMDDAFLFSGSRMKGGER